MSAMRVLMVAAVVLAVSAGAAAARCRVTDPTGTPLNVRTTPNGRIVGVLGNGQNVTVLDRTTSGGKAWAYVGDADAGDMPIGWVFREFISCY